MTDRPILFSAPMIRALLNGRKTQTRRTIKGVDPEEYRYIWSLDECDGNTYAVFSDAPEDTVLSRIHVPIRFSIGDFLWVRETWQSLCEHDGLKPSAIPPWSDVQYPATYDGWVSKRRPGIFMPRWASRLTLEVTGVKVERLQDISEEDAKAEGYFAEFEIDVATFVRGSFDAEKASTFKFGYKHLWDEINGRGAWDANPFVCAVSFIVHKCNIDAMPSILTHPASHREVIL